MLNNIFFTVGYNWAYKNTLSDKFQPNMEYIEKPFVIDTTLLNINNVNNFYIQINEYIPVKLG